MPHLLDLSVRLTGDGFRVFVCDAEGPDDDDVEVLGRFRQIYQHLRESIRDGVPLEWGHAEHPEYVAFKSYAPKINAIIVDRRKSSRQLRILEITSNKWEHVG